MNARLLEAENELNHLSQDVNQAIGQPATAAEPNATPESEALTLLREIAGSLKELVGVTVGDDLDTPPEDDMVPPADTEPAPARPSSRPEPTA